MDAIFAPPNQDDAYHHARRCALAALYLPGLERPISPHRSGAQQVLRALLLNPCEVGSLPNALEQAGLWEAALCLSQPGLLSKAEMLVNSTRVITLACENYPAGWALLSSASPALWLEGELPVTSGIGVVGSREPPPASAELAREVAEEAVRLGRCVVSGGAPGCDWEAGLSAKEHLIELVPCGIDHRWGVGSGCRLSRERAFPPQPQWSATG